MQNAPTRTVFDVITDFLATEPSPQSDVFHAENQDAPQIEERVRMSLSNKKE